MILIPWRLGSNFWKVGSRKVFSVNEHDLESQLQTLDENVPSSRLPKRRRFLVGTHSDDVLENLITEVSEMKGQIEGYKKLAFRHKFSLSFLESMDETFSCCICKRVPPRTPLVGCQVCSTLVGCQRCTDTWFGGPGGLTKPCSKCGAPRGLANSFILKRFDNFVDQISEMMRDTNNNNNNSSDDDDGAGQFDDTLPIVLPADE